MEILKNDYEVHGEVTTIFLNSKKYGQMKTLIDTSDLEKANSFPNRWYIHYNPTVNGFYVVGNTPEINGKRGCAILHRFILDCKKGVQVDHINHDTLDNRKTLNLRETTGSENQQNRIKAQSNNKSGILGVCWSRTNKKWVAKIKLHRKHVYIAYFNTIEEAGKAIKEARAKYMPYSQEALSM